MRKLDSMEMMAIRIMLRAEFDRLHAFVEMTPGGFSRTIYRQRMERVDNLIALFGIGNTITVGV